MLLSLPPGEGGSGQRPGNYKTEYHNRHDQNYGQVTFECVYDIGHP